MPTPNIQQKCFDCFPHLVYQLYTVQVIPLSEIVLALSERDSSLHAIIGRASAYLIARTSPVCGRLYTRYGLAACLLFVQCEFAHGSLTVRSLPAAGPLHVNSSVSPFERSTVVGGACGNNCDQSHNSNSHTCLPYVLPPAHYHQGSEQATARLVESTFDIEENSKYTNNLLLL